MNLKKWMANVSENTPVFTLNLVGTHDCVTRFVQFSHFSKCQDKNIYQQLEMGIRCLDIRVEPKESRLKMVHGIAKAFNTPNHFSKQMDMEDVLSHCYRFLKENPTETIVFQFKNDSCKYQAQSFDNLYHTYIEKNADMWYLENRQPNMSEVRGKIILIRRCAKSKDKSYPLSAGIDFSRWQEQNEILPAPLKLNTHSSDGMVFIVQDRYKYKPKPRWEECIKPFLDSMGEFNGSFIINYLSTAGGLKGPYNNSKHINPRFMNYPLNNNYYYGMIYTDFPSDKKKKKVVSTNFK